MPHQPYRRRCERPPLAHLRLASTAGSPSEQLLALPLSLDGAAIGALNLYSTERDAFDPTDVALATVFAVHATVAVSNARQREQLERKAARRDLIGQAKGILMAQSNVDHDMAFDMLRRASQRLNMKVVDLADSAALPCLRRLRA